MWIVSLFFIFVFFFFFGGESFLFVFIFECVKLATRLSLLTQISIFFIRLRIKIKMILFRRSVAVYVVPRRIGKSNKINWSINSSNWARIYRLKSKVFRCKLIQCVQQLTPIFSDSNRFPLKDFFLTDCIKTSSRPWLLAWNAIVTDSKQYQLSNQFSSIDLLALRH